MASVTVDFDKGPVLKYLGLSLESAPAPDTDPIAFLNLHLAQLPPNILQQFSSITTPKQRTSIVPIRNRRLQYVKNYPPELRFATARDTWPELWQGGERRGVEEGDEERRWAQHDFLEGARQHVGKLGDLLGNYEEEREAERVRNLRRSIMSDENDFVPEEDSDEDEEGPAYIPEQDTLEETKTLFERRIRERFIYGQLEVGLGVETRRCDAKICI